MTPDKLPEELQKDILLSAKAFATGMYPNFPTARDRAEKIFEAGATAWATWKVKHDELKRVLQEFVSNHEAGLLPNRFVYEKAIKILNDGATNK